MNKISTPESFQSKYLKVLFLLSIVAGNLLAQPSYTRTSFSSTYTEISSATGAVQIVSGNGSNQFSQSSGTASYDDGTAYLQLPFAFNYNGTAYSTSNFIGICTNGYLYFSMINTNASKLHAFDNSYLHRAVAPYNVIAPYWDDLSAGAVGSNPSGTILYQINNANAANDDTLIVQFKDVSSQYTAFGGQPRKINFQIWIYKTSGVIEFRYGAATGSIYNTDESASIGLKDATGGNGHFLDAITGSKFLSFTMMSSNKFPGYNYRFTPGAPTAIAAGSYNVGVGQTYNSISEAIANLNHRGVSGAVIFNLTDAVYDTTTAGGKNIFPLVIGKINGASATNSITIQKASGKATLTYSGFKSANGFIGTFISYNTIGISMEPMIALLGADYVTLKNISLVETPGSNLLEYGLYVSNASATDGATNNLFSGITVKLDRSNLNSIGILQTSQLTAIVADSASNFNNSFKDITINNCYAGIQMLGTLAFPDNNNVIGSTVCSNFNFIGDSIADDIGNGVNSTYGIKALFQKNFKVYNSVIRNISSTGESSTVDGIYIDHPTLETYNAGTIEVYNNKIFSLNNYGNSSTSVSETKGISIDLPANASTVARIYNNWIFNLQNSSNYVDTWRRVVGINVQPDSNGIGSTFYVEHNSVALNVNNPIASSACYEIGIHLGPVLVERNNIFANFSGVQSGNSKHYCWITTSQYGIGPTGSLSDYNDLYIANTNNGFVGLCKFGDKATIADWRAMLGGSGPDDASVSTNPNFLNNNNDLHAGSTFCNGGGTTPSAWITNDIDCTSRTSPQDIGACNINTCGGKPTAGIASVTPSTICSAKTTVLSLTSNSSGAGITFQWQQSANVAGPFSNITGGTSNPFATSAITSVTYFRCIVNCTSSSTSDTTNVVQLNINALPNVTVNLSSAKICNPNGLSVALVASGASTYAWLPTQGLTPATGPTTSAFPAGTTIYTVTGTDGNGCSSTSTTAVSVGKNVAINVNPLSQFVCNNATTPLAADAGTTESYNMTSISHSPLTGTGGTINFPTVDDDYKLINFPAGFNFEFFGNIYPNCYIATNGFVSFGLGYTNKTSNTIPSTSNPDNYVALCYSNLTLAQGTVDTFTIGITPNRKFVVRYTNVPFYSTNVAGYTGSVTGQIIFCEKSNIIEMHISTVDNGTSTKLKTMGIENLAGTIGYAPATRNNLNYSFLTGEAWRFSPNGGPVSYTWTPATFLSSTTSATPSAINVLTSTIYTVTATEINSCSNSATVSITASNLNVVASASKNQVCTPTSVTMTATKSGGITPYTYLWNTGSASSTFNATVNSTRTYTVTVTDGNSCSRSSTVLIIYGGSIVVGSSSNSPICSGNTLALSSSGGSTYSWSGPNSFISTLQNPTITNATSINAGVYTVNGNNGAGCTGTSSVNVIMNALPAATASFNTPLCNGFDLNLTSGGGTQYAWSGPNSFSSTNQNPTINNVSSLHNGVYTVTVSNANGCTKTASVSVVVNANPTISVSNNSPLCASNTLQLTLTGSAASFVWSGPNGFISTIQNPLISNIQTDGNGVYNVTATSVAGCSAISSTNVLINSLPAITLTTNSPQCIGGTLNLNSSGGSLYQWTGPNGFISVSQNPVINNIAASNGGVYMLTVTNANNCSVSSTTNVLVNSPIPIYASVQSDTVCTGSSAQLFVSDGLGTSYSTIQIPYMPLNENSGSVSFPTNDNDNKLINFPVGFSFNYFGNNYSTLYIGVNGYISFGAGSNSRTAQLFPDLTTPNNMIAFCYNDLKLSSGSIDTFTVGVVPNRKFVIRWNNVPMYATTLAISTGNTYGQIILCEKTNIIEIHTGQILNGAITSRLKTSGIENSTGTVGYAIASRNNFDYQITTPEAIRFIPNSAGTLNFNWLPSTNLSSSTIYNPVVSVVTSNTTYSVTAINTSGCTSTATVFVSPDNINVTAASNPSAICSAQNVTLSASANSGSAPYFYLWSNGVTTSSQIVNLTVNSTFTVTVTDNRGCSNTSSTTIIVTGGLTANAFSNSPVCELTSINLSTTSGNTFAWSGPSGFSSTLQNPSIPNASLSNSGTFTVTATDIGGCTSSATVSVIVNPAPVISISNSSPVCSGGNVNLFSSGGVTYSWNGANGFSSTDQNPLVNSAVSNSSGNYVVAVTGVNGCSATAQTSVSVLALPVADISSNSPVCAGSTISLASNGNVNCVWTGVSNFLSTNCNSTIPNSTLANGGIYYVVLTGVNGCTTAASLNVIVNSLPTITCSSNSPVCESSSIQLNSSGGVNYLWTGPNNFSSSVQNPLITNSDTSKAGIYFATIVDANGCSASSSVVVSVLLKPVPVVSSNAPICAGNTLSLFSSGGVSYSWTGPNSFSSTEQNLFLLNASTINSGVYTVAITGANGCSVSSTTTAIVNALPLINVSNNGPKCSGADVQFISSGGATYSWSGPNGFSSAIQNPVLNSATAGSSGNYIVTVTSTDGCSSTASTNLKVYDYPVATIISNSPMCAGSNLNLQTGVADVYQWTGPNGFNSTIQNPVIGNSQTNASGLYSVTGTNGGLCSATVSVNVIVNYTATVTTSASPAVLCAGTSSQLDASSGSINSYTVNSIPFASFTGNAGAVTFPTSNNDNKLISFPTGFNFKFFNSYYNSCYISINGFISFGSGSSSYTAQLFPDTITPNNMIALCYSDLLMSPGQIDTFTIGSFPNRKFVVRFNAVPFNKSLVQTGQVTGQIVLYEVSNTIELYLATVDNGTTTARLKTTGIENSNGTYGLTPPFRNNVNFAVVTPEAWQFKPAGGTIFYQWNPSTFLNSAVVPNPVAQNVASATNYTVSATTENGCSSTATLNLIANLLPVLIASPSTAVICNPGGVAIPLTITGANSYSWIPALGLSQTTGATQNALPSANTIYTVTGTSIAGCTSTVTSSINVGAKVSLNFSPSNAVACSASSAIQLNANAGTTSAYAMSAIPYSPDSGSAGVISFATLDDDYTQISLPQNFKFEYFGNTYSTLYIGTNGYVSFAYGYANKLSQTFPSTTLPNFDISLCLTNLSLASGLVDTFTTGVIPYRKFVIRYLNVPIVVSTGGTSGSVSGQINLFETSNIIEMHLSSVNNGVTSRTKTCGIENGSGTIGYSPSSPNRNNLNYFFSTPEAWRFVPSGGNTSYNWSPATNLNSTTSATPVATGISSSTIYTVSAFDLTGCSATSTITIIASNLSIAASANPSVICTTQVVSLNGLAAGGGSPYSYLWSTGETLAVINQAATPGSTFTVTVTDSKGCSRSTSVSVVQCPPLNVTVSSNNPVCENNSLNLSATGGTFYSWTGPNGFTSTNQNPIKSAVQLIDSGFYYVTASNVSGATGTASVHIEVLPMPSVTAASNSPVCENSVITLTASGGVSYNWSGPNGFVSTLQNPVINSASINSTGSYSVIVTGNNGCTSSTQTSIIVNQVPIILLNSNSPVCENQTLQLFSIGGISYQWSGPNSFISTLQNPTILNAPTANSGNYFVTVASDLGCTTTSSIGVVIKELTPVSATTTNSIVCFGGTTNLQATILNSDSVNSYSWQPATFLSSTSVASPVINNFSASTNFTLTVMNVAGCSSTATVGVELSNPDVQITGATFVCEGTIDSLTAIGSGGSGNYSYLWSDGNSTSNINPIIDSAITYFVTVTDVNTGCTKISSISIDLFTNSSVSINSNSPLCAGNNLQLNVSNSSAYSWTGPNGFTSSLQNPELINATISATGVYHVVVTSVFGCTSSASVSVIINPLPIVTASNSSPVCDGISLQFNSSGGNDYSWSGVNGFNSTLQNPVVMASLNNSGLYTVIATDVNSCSSSASTLVIVNSLPVANIISNSPVCVNSTLNLNGSGGINYMWSGSSGTISTNQNVSITSVQQSNAGNYFLTVTDANGCSASTSSTVVVNNLPEISTSSNSPACVGNSVTLSTLAGVSYQWSGPNSFSSTQQNPVINNVGLTTSGSYCVTVTDANSCSNSACADVNVFAYPIVNASSNSPQCTGNSLSLVSSGGGNLNWTGPDNFSSTTQNPVINNATVLAQGIYLVTSTNGGTCSSTATVNVQIGSPITVAASATPSTLCSGQNSQLDAGTSVISTYTLASIPYSVFTGSTGSVSFPSLNNNFTSVNFPSGFSFKYFNTSYTSCFIATNGYISFGAGSIVYTAQQIPDTTPPNNMIALCFTDLILTAGQVDTFTTGATPNRKFVIRYTGVPLYKSTGNLGEVSGQIVLFEGSNTIEIHVTKIDHATLTTRLKTLGIENSNGTYALSPSGKNNSTFVVLTPEAYRFVPVTDNVTYSWQPTTNLQVPQIPNAVASNVSSSIDYTVTALSPLGCTATYSVSLNVLPVPNTIVSANGPTQFCPGGSVTLTVSPIGSYLWSNAQSTSSIVVSTTGVYTVTVTSANGCSKSATPISVDAICPTPTNPFSNNLTSTSTQVNWTINSCGMAYQVQYKRPTDTVWTYITINSNTGFRVLTGLQTSTTYQWQVRTRCNSVTPYIWSAFSVMNYFTTGTARSESEIINQPVLSVFPSPTNGLTTIGIIGMNGECRLKLVNVLGETLVNKNIYPVDGIYEGIIDLTEMPVGVYQLLVSNNGESLYSKIIKN